MALLDLGSLRARKARFGRVFARLMLPCTVLIILLVLGGVVMIGARLAVGWLVTSLAAPFYMVVYWYSKELEKLPPVDGKTVDCYLSGEILGSLKKKSMVRDLVIVVAKEKSGAFLLARFGLRREFLGSIAASQGIMLEQVWEGAMSLQKELHGKEIGAGVVLLALTRLMPGYEQILAYYKLDFEDLKNGVRWYVQAQEAAERSRRKMRTGGMARDWSFGYTPLLSKFGRNISEEIARHGGRTMSLLLPSRQKIVGEMIEIFSKGGRQNVTIVAPDGAGKTSVVHDFAERILDVEANIPEYLKYRQVWLLNAGRMVMAAKERGELERLINQLLMEVVQAKNVVICLDDAQLFFEEGVGAIDISNLLLPVLEHGGYRMIMTMNEQVLLRIGRRLPALVNVINRVNIAPASFEETMAAMEDKVVQMEHDSGVFFRYQALKKAYELSERYIYNQVMPGRAITLLLGAGNYAEGRVVSAKSVEMTVEATLGVKVGVADDAAEREKLLSLEDLLHERMIGQDKAVQVVADALRRARAGVRNTGRPVGTFLFLGPTGVGKTELAKALAAVYYGGEDRLVRVDLNQFVTDESVRALTADGADNPNSLAAQVMKNPFCVVLLDEIEKANQKVLSALLQVLDEGILRDALGREVSFRDTIIIATSNAAATEIRAKVEAGENITNITGEMQNTLVNMGIFSPEFLNRFDEMVVFGPLTKPELLRVVDLMVAEVNRTLMVQKITVQVSPEARELLMEAGYDPKLGARPMRRMVQRVVENEVAKQTLKGQVMAGGTVVLTGEMVREDLRREESLGV